jgi:hypothetical protein
VYIAVRQIVSVPTELEQITVVIVTSTDDAVVIVCSEIGVPLIPLISTNIRPASPTAEMVGISTAR